MTQQLIDFLRTLHSAEGIGNLIRTGGFAVLIAIIFSETGLLVGFFLPGDSLLVTAGIFAASDGAGGPGLFNVYLLATLTSLAAIIGDQLGFYLGHKTGPMIFSKEDSLFFKKQHVKSAHDFYDKHGGGALVLARFMPIFRTFVPFVAGVARMQYKKFLRFSIMGGVLWVWSMVFLGYALGHSPLANQLHKIILVVVFVSILPMLITVTKKLLKKKRSDPAMNSR